MTLEVIVLAAGQGTRMHSDLPKVMHELGGQPLLAHVLDRTRELRPRAIHVVYGHGAEQVREYFAENDLHWVLQAQQRGTAHAVLQALPDVAPDAVALVLYGDVPLIATTTLRALVDAAVTDALALLTTELDDATGYGRIIRGGDRGVAKIVEQKDATADELAISEINAGLLAAPARRLRTWLTQIDSDNAQGEFYLTDVAAIANQDGAAIVTCHPQSRWEIMGVNSKSELARLERRLQQQRARELMDSGVTLLDPARFDLRGQLQAGRDVVIDVNVVFEGNVVLGNGVHIGPNNLIRNTSIGDGSTVLANCVIEDAIVGRNCRIGPFARLRPGPELADGVQIGNFVELKKSRVGSGSKINHLSYVGDTIVGKNVNIGAGTITCNYDGANKHQTVIGDNAFIGSDTQLVAPVTVGEGATIGAGSTITKDTPSGALTLSRAPQRTRRGWKRPVKKHVNRES
jgi:bifunctional UDP-N-acetylglucosamine pyrophosphorylase/glucosamine-1-phosphate N-acetyltransferase